MLASMQAVTKPDIEGNRDERLVDRSHGFLLCVGLRSSSPAEAMRNGIAFQRGATQCSFRHKLASDEKGHTVVLAGPSSALPDCNSVRGAEWVEVASALCQFFRIEPDQAGMKLRVERKIGDLLIEMAETRHSAGNAVHAAGPCVVALDNARLPGAAARSLPYIFTYRLTKLTYWTSLLG